MEEKLYEIPLIIICLILLVCRSRKFSFNKRIEDRGNISTNLSVPAQIAHTFASIWDIYVTSISFICSFVLFSLWRLVLLLSKSLQFIVLSGSLDLLTMCVSFIGTPCLFCFFDLILNCYFAWRILFLNLINLIQSNVSFKWRWFSLLLLLLLWYRSSMKRNTRKIL